MSLSDKNLQRDLSEPLEALFGPGFMPVSTTPTVRSQTADERRNEASHPENKGSTMPLEVMIVTADYEIRGLIHVSRVAREDRRISDLLNDRRRRFLAVTDAQVAIRTAPSSPRQYSFLQLHLDNILMLHPSTQSLVRQAAVAGQTELGRFDALRDRLNQIGRVLP